MTTRTRSRARQQALDESQGRITDTFKTTRRGTTAAGKLIKEEPSIVKQEPKEVTPPLAPVVTIPAPVVKKVTKKTSAKTTKKSKQEIVLPTENVVVEAAVPEALQSPPRRARKTPTPTNSPQAQKSSARRIIFREEKIEPKEEPSSEPSDVPSSSQQPQPVEVSPPFALKESKPDAKIRSKLDLQARLAEKSAALKRIHQQNAANKSKKVEHLSNLLKSPQKIPPLILSPVKKTTLQRSPVKRLAPLFTTPVKRAEAIRITNPEGSASKIPDYVLPTHKTPAKEVDSDEEREQQEQKREQLEKGKTALLLDTVKKNLDVPLPNKYQALLEKFHCCDRIVSIFSGRGKRCESTEILKNVSKNIRKDFTKANLAQIVAVYPKSYNLLLKEQKDVCGRGTGRFDMDLEANVNDDLTEYMRPESPMKQQFEEPLPKVLPGHCISPMKSPRKKAAPALPREAELDLSPRLEGWRMLCRKYVMHHLLAERVKMFYQKFMEKRGESAEGDPRLHPTFLSSLDSECDDIEQAPLPEPPRKEENFKDVRQFMATVKELETAVDIAIRELKGKGDISETRNILLSSKKFARQMGARPISTKSLLEKIREKDAQKKAAEASRDPVAERRYICLELLHSKILRILLNIFTQKGCRSMELALVVEKLEYSAKRTRSELRECLELMCDVAKEVGKIVEVASRKYLQIEKDQHDVVRSSVKTALEKTPAPSFPFSTAKSR